MKKARHTNFHWILTLVVITNLMVFPGLILAGSLEPAASPAPTMKTLDEIESRIAIPASDSPVAVYTISESGSYYLTGDRLCSGVGIQVDVDNVTIDLKGYSLIGSGTDSGIYMVARSNAEIRNGTVRGFQYGIMESGSSSDYGHRVIGVRSIDNASRGISLNSTGNLVKDCTISHNGTSASSEVQGIYVNDGSTVIGNIVKENGASASSSVYALRTAEGCTVINNTVYRNGESATGTVRGIWTESGSTVTNNTVTRNGASTGGIVAGIRANSYSTLDGNTIRDNGRNNGSTVFGIYSGTGNTVTNNTVCRNGYSATGTVYGIHLVGQSLVDQNTVYGQGTNINAVGANTFGINHAP